MDISEGGVCLLTNYDIPAKAKLCIKFVLLYGHNDNIEHARLLEALGEVRYNNFAREEHRLGVCFTDIASEDRQVIAGFVKRAVDL